MTTINIDWANVATTAAANFNDQVNQAAGGITLAISDLMADGSLNGPAKLAILQQVAMTLSNKDALVAFFNGQAPKAPKALGGSPSGDPDADLQDQLDAANARLRQLESDRKALEEVLHAFNIPALPRMDAPYDGNDMRNKARTKRAEIERTAAESVNPTDSVKKADIRTKLEEAARLASNLSTGSFSSAVNGKDALVAKLGEISPLVS